MKFRCKYIELERKFLLVDVTERQKDIVHILSYMWM